MSILTGPVPTPRTDIHAPTISTAERERFAYLLLDIHGLLPLSPIRPVQWDSWWECARELLREHFLEEILPVPAPYTLRSEHRDIPQMTEPELRQEEGLARFRLQLEVWRNLALGARPPSRWLTERLTALLKALSGR